MAMDLRPTEVVEQLRRLDDDDEFELFSEPLSGDLPGDDSRYRFFNECSCSCSGGCSPCNQSPAVFCISFSWGFRAQIDEDGSETRDPERFLDGDRFRP